MFDNLIENELQRAILICVDTGEFDAEVSVNELEELAKTAGAEVIAKIIQKRPDYDGATCVGNGKLEEIKELAGEDEDILLIFDHELTGSQLKNIEDVTGLAVIDRTMLILDIFAQRAVTGEGKLQVELAQQNYRPPRLVGIGKKLSRLGGGIGTRGPGESKLESDRRHIRRRIASLEEQLKELEKKRGMLRERRKKNGVITAAIVGYTNAGKSTLLNRLTGAGVLAKDMLFATLDLTSRGIELPDGRTVILVDTVGFIRRLPHQLIEAFKSTLEEAKNSDLIINVCDASSPELLNELKVTTNLLNELGAGETKKITVLNKCDIVEEVPRLTGEQYGKVVEISAISGEGIEKLLCEISRELEPSQVRMKLKIPYSDAGITAKIREEGKVFSEEYLSDGIEADVLVDKKILYLAEKYRKINH